MYGPLPARGFPHCVICAFDLCFLSVTLCCISPVSSPFLASYFIYRLPPLINNSVYYNTSRFETTSLRIRVLQCSVS